MSSSQQINGASQQGIDTVAGIAVFASMAYVAFANPIILQQAGMPTTAVFFATCVMAAVASYASASYTVAPAALAPGLALSIVISEFLSQSPTFRGEMTWESALVVCFAAGLVMLMLSVTGYRRTIIQAIPETIKLAVVGGIGAVLAESAIDIVNDPKGNIAANRQLFAVGLSILVLGYIFVRSLALRVSDPAHGRLLDTIGRAAFPISVLVVAVLAATGSGLQPLPNDGGNPWLWLNTGKSFGTIVAAAFSPQGIILFIFIFYILLIDIVGSPYHLIIDDKPADQQRELTAAERETVRRSFLIDSGANLLAPIAGTSPVVYYAENFTGKVLGGRGPRVAIIPSIGFALLAIVGAVLWLRGESLGVLVPGIAVAPALFFVGLLIISKALIGSIPAFLAEQGVPAQGQQQRDLPQTLRDEFLALGQRLPAALAIVLTPIGGFEIGVGVGILTYVAFFVVLPEGNKGEFREFNGTVAFVATLAIVSLALKLMLITNKVAV